ncbi:MAG: GxxExxY protein [Elusimicrobiota bacterium]
MQYEEITKEILKASFRVHKILGFGFLEKVYQNAMVIELKKNGLKVECEKPIKVYYDREIVGEYEADLVVEDKVIVELKAVEELNKKFEVQLVNYLTATELEVGLLLNFGKESLQYKRKVRTLNKKSC